MNCIHCGKEITEDCVLLRGRSLALWEEIDVWNNKYNTKNIYLIYEKFAQHFMNELKTYPTYINHKFIPQHTPDFPKEIRWMKGCEASHRRHDFCHTSCYLSNKTFRIQASDQFKILYSYELEYAELTKKWFSDETYYKSRKRVIDSYFYINLDFDILYKFDSYITLDRALSMNGLLPHRATLPAYGSIDTEKPPSYEMQLLPASLESRQ